VSPEKLGGPGVSPDKTMSTAKPGLDSTAPPETPEGFVPLPEDEARALMTEALTGIDRSTLLAERAEAEAQMRAAEATLGLTPPAANGRPAPKEERDEAAQKSPPVEADVVEAVVVATGPEFDVPELDVPELDVPELDVPELRRAAASARAADDVLARAAFEAADRPLPADGQLGTAETAFARATEIQDDLPAAWRRLVGALISATGMAIVIGALGWNTYWLLVPIALIAIMTVDLRVSGRAAREASAEAARELATVGVAGSDGLERVREERARVEDAEGRLAAARTSRDAAYARFGELAPGRTPSEVDDVVAEYEAQKTAAAEAARVAEAARAREAARITETARAEAARAARAKAEAEATRAAEAARSREAARAAEITRTREAAAEPNEDRTPGPESAGPESAEPESAEPESAEPVPQLAAAAEWWFGPQRPPSGPHAPSTPVPGPAAPPEPERAPAAPAEPPPPVRALAERLSAEGRAALARIEAQLAALDRVELAKRSLEWHESQAAGGKQDRPSPAEVEDAEA
jgi:hypothetical protein